MGTDSLIIVKIICSGQLLFILQSKTVGIEILNTFLIYQAIAIWVNGTKLRNVLILEVILLIDCKASNGICFHEISLDAEPVESKGFSDSGLAHKFADRDIYRQIRILSFVRSCFGVFHLIKRIYLFYYRLHLRSVDLNCFALFCNIAKLVQMQILKNNHFFDQVTHIEKLAGLVSRLELTVTLNFIFS